MERTSLEVGEITAYGLRNINVVLGRNGSGKSRFLRAIEQGLLNNAEFKVAYVSPERAGVFKRDGNILNQMESNPQWMGSARRMNQVANFKAASANLLREVETAYLRRLQDNPEIRSDQSRNFRTERLDSINRLLSNVTICQTGSDFEFRDIEGAVIQPEHISSGESECVSLAVEIMYFLDNATNEKFNLLLIDEPDVHLHPDLQARLAQFLINSIEALEDELKERVSVILATHSAPFVCALSQSDRTSIGTKDFGLDSISFYQTGDQLKKIAPFFGHPLSLVLSQDVMLILEGEDDERVWQQASRSSEGKIKVFPVIASTVDQQTELEKFSASLIDSLYDSPKAYSLRDGDGITEPLKAIGSVKRFRLQCYSVENLLLTDQVLSVLGKTWEEFVSAADDWLSNNKEHRDRDKVSALVKSSDRLRNTKIKGIRQLVCAICESNKPWEVVVGQAIGSLDVENLPTDDFGLPSFVGVETISTILAG